MPRRWSTREVLWAIEGGGELGRIAVAYVEWAGPRSQDVVVDWTVIDDAASAAGLRRRGCRGAAAGRGVNAIGAALLKGLALIEGNGFEGWPQGDRPLRRQRLEPAARRRIAEARDAAIGQGVVINGLAVLCDDCSGRPGAGNLEEQFEEQLIAGPGAFVVTADGRAAFADAVRRKLVLEIAGPAPGTSGRTRRCSRLHLLTTLTPILPRK